MTTHVVYRLYDSSDILLYVGSTARFENRLSEHRNTKRWGDSIDHWTVDGPHPLGHARWLESEAIRAEKPIFNRRRPQEIEVPEEERHKAVARLTLPLGLAELLQPYRPVAAPPPVAAQAGKAPSRCVGKRIGSGQQPVNAKRPPT